MAEMVFELLYPEQMSEADRLTIESGISGYELMKNAGSAVAAQILSSYPSCRHVVILCGSGNNGGDGFVVARLLIEQGKNVHVLICGDKDKIRGDAAQALSDMPDGLLLQDQPEFGPYDLIVDALLGTGLDRLVSGSYAELIDRANKSGRPIVSIDLPSGIHGANGAVLGRAIKAQMTVTFFRLKIGHLLMPGRAHCGEVHLSQIGILSDVLDDCGVAATHNVPSLWMDDFPVPSITAHKYTRGHVFVISGPEFATGASRLAARAALRSGSGLVTILGERRALSVHANHLTSIMLSEIDGENGVDHALDDERVNVIALGPGLPPDQATRDLVIKVLSHQQKVVLDAGALSAFDFAQADLFKAIKSRKEPVILTPHFGEFRRLFPEESKLESKLDQVRMAAKTSGAVVILKGADSVVATPDGKMSISNNAPPWLASAGSGDVLTGIVAGLLAQNMPEFHAASAAVWLHGDAANVLGPALISEELDDGLKIALQRLLA